MWKICKLSRDSRNKGPIAGFREESRNQDTLYIAHLFKIKPLFRFRDISEWKIEFPYLWNWGNYWDLPVKDFYFIIDTGGCEADSAHSVARSHSKEMVVEFVNLSSNNREMDWRFLLNHKKNKGKLSFIIIIQFFTYLL